MRERRQKFDAVTGVCVCDSLQVCSEVKGL